MRHATALAIALTLSACGDAVEERYGSWDEAKRAGAVERGWVPPFVPSTARNLRSIHDLDLNSQRLTFKLPTDAVQPMIDAAAPVSALHGKTLERAIREVGLNGHKNVNVNAYLMCTPTYSGAIVAERNTGHVVYLSPAEWGRKSCPRPL